MNQNQTNAKILIVDDTVKNLQVLGAILREQGYHVIVTKNGVQALQSVENSLPDLILLDVMMPEMDGYETCKRLKESPNTREIPVIFLTAKEEAEDIVHGFELGAVDYVTKPFNGTELLARVRTHLELKFSKEALIKEQVKMLEELEQARITQMSLLPDPLPLIPQVQIACKYVPMEQIGGDFYNVFPIEENQFGILVADVAGHGVSAALIAFMVSGIFNNSVGAGSPEIVMNLTNGYLDGKIQEGKFSTMFYMVYDAATKVLTYVSAGHPPGLVIRAQTREIFRLDTRGFLVGVFDSMVAKYEEKTFQLLPGDKVLVYTDGITEVINEQNQMLGISGLMLFLEENCQLSITELIGKLYEFGQRYSNSLEFQDDVTLVGLEIEGEL